MNDRVEAQPVLMSLFKRWWLILLLVALGAGGGYAASIAIEPVYQARTTLLVGDPTGSLSVSKEAIEASQLLAGTYTNLIRSERVLGGVVDKVGLEGTSWTDLKDDVHAVLGPHGTQTIVVTVYSDSPEAAERIAAAVADQVVALDSSGSETSADETTEFISEQMGALQTNIRSADAEVALLREDLADAQKPWEQDQLQTEIRDQQELIIGWQNNYSALLSFVAREGSPTTIQVLDNPTAPLKPARPDTPLNMAFGAGIGFLVACGIAYVLAFRTSRSTEQPETVERATTSNSGSNSGARAGNVASPAEAPAGLRRG